MYDMPAMCSQENFFDDVLEASVSELNFKTITDGLVRDVLVALLACSLNCYVCYRCC